MFFFFPYRLRIFFYSVGKNESIKVSHSKQQNIFLYDLSIKVKHSIKLKIFTRGTRGNSIDHWERSVVSCKSMSIVNRSTRNVSSKKLICLFDNEEDFPLDQLKELFEKIILFDNCEECFKDLNQLNNETVFLIVSDRYENSFVHQIENIKWIWSILIYHHNEQRNISSKVNIPFLFLTFKKDFK